MHRFNPRAYAAYIAGILINVVGFAGATGRTVPLAATRIYQLAFFTGFGVSCLVYILLNYIWPPVGAEQCKVFEEIDHTDWEHGGRPLDQERRSVEGSQEDDVWDAEDDKKDGGARAYVTATA